MMMKKLLLFVISLLTASPALAQKTVVTALVQDSNNSVYQNCIYSVTFVGQSTLPGPYLISGSVFQTDFGGSRCDGNGNLSIQLYANSLISPAPSQWEFDICDQTGKYCGSLLVTVAGGTQNISSPLTSVLPILPPSGGGGGFYQTIQQSGVPQTPRQVLNLLPGSGIFIVCADDPGNFSTDCTFTGQAVPGSNKQAIFNNNGAFGTAAGYTFDIATGNLVVPGIVTATSFHTTGPGAGTLSGTFGQAAPTLVAGNNYLYFDPATGLPDCSANGNPAAPCGGGGVNNEQIRYADQFQWTQSPSGTISVGANTVTINAILGIGVASTPPGVLGTYHTIHKIRIFGTGTPEVVTLTATTCTGIATGTCTITFTAANTHSAGFTLGTATAGFQEAVDDAFGQWSGLNPTTSFTVKGSPYNINGHFIFYGTLNVTNIGGNGGSSTIDCAGATLEDNVAGAPMISYGNSSWGGPEHGNIRDCHFAVFPGVGRAANGTQIFVLDKGQNLAIRNNDFQSFVNSTDLIDTMVQVSGDQGFVLDHNEFSNLAMKCDATWCGPVVLGDATSGAANGNITNNNFTMGQASTAVEWISGNGLTLSRNIFQNWVKYPWRYLGGFEPVSDIGGNYYEGNCGLVNPDFGVAGFSCNTGRQVGPSGSAGGTYFAGADSGAQLNYHRFSGTGGTLYQYYIVGNDGSGHSTRPLFIGDASTNGVTTFPILYLKFGAATYDVLRIGPIVGDGTDAAPWGVSNWAVATGQTCSVNPCSFTETFASPTSYTVLSEFQPTGYTPFITYWPVPLSLNGIGAGEFSYSGPAINGFVNTTAPSSGSQYYDGVFTSGTVGAGGGVTGMHLLVQQTLAAGGGATVNPGAMILNPDGVTNNMTGRKGRINMPSYSFHGGSAQTNNLMYQIYDSEANKTLATAGHQGLAVAADTGIGYDDGKGFFATQCGTTRCTWYLNHIMDTGTSAVMKLSSTGLDIKAGTNFTIGGTPIPLSNLAPINSFYQNRFDWSGTDPSAPATAGNAGVWANYYAGPPMTFSKIAYIVGTADNTANTYDVGIYYCDSTPPNSCESGSFVATLIAHTGPVAGTTSFAAAGGFTAHAFLASGTIPGPGLIYLAYTGSTPSAKFETNNANAISTTCNVSVAGVSGSTLNSTITLPVQTLTRVCSMPVFLLLN